MEKVKLWPNNYYILLTIINFKLCSMDFLPLSLVLYDHVPLKFHLRGKRVSITPKVSKTVVPSIFYLSLLPHVLLSKSLLITESWMYCLAKGRITLCHCVYQSVGWLKEKLTVVLVEVFAILHVSEVTAQHALAKCFRIYKYLWFIVSCPL